MDRFDRLLGSLEGDDARTRRSKIRSFEWILLLAIVAEHWEHVAYGWLAGNPARAAATVFATLCCAAALTARLRRAAFLALAAEHVFVVFTSFPITGNHRYLAMVLCFVCGLLDPAREQEQRLLVRSVRWIGCVVLFFSGVQKLVHGYYLYGLLPAYQLAEPRFGTIFRQLMPAPEAARILAYDRMDGAGPYFAAAPLFVLASNFVWAAEAVLPFLLAVARTRAFATAAAVAFLVLIEVVAREMFFGMIFLNVLLMFAATDVNRRIVPFVAILCAYLVLARAGVLPAMEFY